MGFGEGVAQGIQLALTKKQIDIQSQYLDLKRQEVDAQNKRIEAELLGAGYVKDDSGKWVPGELLKNKQQLEIEKINADLETLKLENNKYKTLWQHVAAQTTADALVKSVEAGDPRYINALPEYTKNLFEFKKIRPFNPVDPKAEQYLRTIHKRFLESPLVAEYLTQAGIDKEQIKDFNNFKDIAIQNAKTLNKLVGISEFLDGKEDVVLYPEIATIIGAKRFVADSQFNYMVDAFKSLTNATSKTYQPSVYELKKRDIEAYQREIESWGKNKGLNGIEPKALTPEQKGKVFDYMWTKGIKLDSQDKKIIESVNKMVSLADSASKLTPDQLGPIDKKVFDIKKYLGIDPDSAESVLAYNLIKSTLRHALFGSALTEAEIKSFEDAFANLNQRPEVIFKGLANMYKQIHGQLQSVIDTNDPYITIPLFGGMVSDINSIIDRLNNLAKKYGTKAGAKPETPRLVSPDAINVNTPTDTPAESIKKNPFYIQN
jgi:hypothetical protein